MNMSLVSAEQIISFRVKQWATSVVLKTWELKSDRNVMFVSALKDVSSCVHKKNKIYRHPHVWKWQNSLDRFYVKMFLLCFCWTTQWDQVDVGIQNLWGFFFSNVSSSKISILGEVLFLVWEKKRNNRHICPVSQRCWYHSEADGDSGMFPSPKHKWLLRRRIKPEEMTLITELFIRAPQVRTPLDPPLPLFLQLLQIFYLFTSEPQLSNFVSLSRLWLSLSAVESWFGKEFNGGRAQDVLNNRLWKAVSHQELRVFLLSHIFQSARHQDAAGFFFQRCREGQ